jgi:succinyl-diaminopimelate desuccinylase
MRLIAALGSYKEKVEERESKLFAPPEAPRQFVWGRFSTTMIKAGEKVNIIPGGCEFWFDRRLLPEERLDQAESELRDYFKKAVEETRCDASLEIVNRQQGYHTPEDLVFVQTVSEEIRRLVGESLPFAAELGGNDGSFFAKNGIPVICYGPLRSETRYHGVDEFVYLDDLRNVRNLIISLGKVERDKIVNAR